MISALACTAQVGPAPLAVRDATVRLDEARVPFASVTLTLPYAPGSVDVLDPRGLPKRVIVDVERRFSGSEPASAVSAAHSGQTAAAVTAAWAGRTARDLTAQYGDPWNPFGFRATQRRRLNLSLRSRRVDHSAGTVTVDASSDEALLIAYGLMSDTPVSPTALTVRAAVELVLSRAVPGAVLGGSAGAHPISAESAVWQPGVSGWDYLSPLTASAGLRLWCDEARVWHLEPPETVITPGQASLSADASVTAAVDSISLDDDEWADGVVVVYSWTDASNVRREVIDAAGDITSSRVLRVQHERPFPGPGEAAARLRKIQARGRVLSVTAVADPSVYPAQAATLTVPPTPAQSGWVTAVEWRVPDDVMSVTTRDLVDTPNTAWLFLRAGIAWEDSPPGVSWTDTDPDPAEEVA